MHYQLGPIVNQGDPLIDIDPRPYPATLEQAQRTLVHDRGVLTQAVMDLSFMADEDSADEGLNPGVT